MLRPTGAHTALSAECPPAERPGYEDLHGACRQTADVPLPGITNLLLMSHCPCSCHAPGAGEAR